MAVKPLVLVPGVAHGRLPWPCRRLLRCRSSLSNAGSQSASVAPTEVAFPPESGPAAACATDVRWG